MNDKEEGLKLKEIYKFIWNRKISLFLSGFAPAVITLIICLFLPKRYTAKAVILAPEALSGSISTPLGYISSGLTPKGKLSSLTIISLLNSETMRTKIVKKFDLIKHYRLERTRYPQVEAEKIVERRTDVVYSEKEGLIYIFFESKDPILSANVVNFYINYLDTLNLQHNLTERRPIVIVVDPPIPPVEKSFPKTKISIIVSSFFGIFLYLMFLWLRNELI
ncbi:MAG: Wzz/FepE/Etk N-terminal domain-containing protein [candidate division WOR-3 bacterium]